MAKLPGINYGRAVPTMGRENPGGPLRVAQAESAAAASLGRAVGVTGDAYRSLKEEEGRSALVEASSVWRQGEAEIRINPNIEERNEQAETLRDNIFDEFTGNMNNISIETFKNKWNEWSQTKIDGIVTDGIQEQYSIQRQNVETNVLSMSREGDITEALNYLNESAVINDSEKKKLMKAARLEFSLGDLDRTSNSGDPDMIAELLEEIKGPNYTGPFKDDVRKAAIGQLQTAFNTAVLAYEKRVSHDRERFASELELSVRRGVAGPVDIMAAFEENDANGDPMITGPKRTQLLAIYESQQQQLQDDYNKAILVKEFMAADQPMDRENLDHVDAVDFAYDDFMRRNGDDPQLVAEYGITLAGATNILPESLEADLRRMAFAGGAKEVESMANIYEELEKRAPQVIDGIGTREKAIYKSSMAFFRGGTDLDKAVELARENAYKNPEEKSNLSQRYSIEFSPNITDGMISFQSWLEGEDQFDIAIIGEAPQATNAQYTAYRSMEKAYWINTDGNPDLTREFARQDYKRLFSTSTINGKWEIMPYSPEREYGVEPGNELLKEDVQAFYKAEKIAGDKPFLLPDGRTARDKIGARTYAVYITDKFGNPRLHDRRWKLDPAARTRLKQEQSDEQQKNLRMRKHRETLGIYPRVRN